VILIIVILILMCNDNVYNVCVLMCMYVCNVKILMCVCINVCNVILLLLLIILIVMCDINDSNYY